MKHQLISAKYALEYLDDNDRNNNNSNDNKIIMF